MGDARPPDVILLAESATMLIALSLSRKRGASLQSQIADQLRQQIVSGRLEPGCEMPPSRELAAQYRISRNTVLQAYDRLMSEGYLSTIGGVGTFVTKAVPDSCLTIAASAAQPLPVSTARAPVIFATDVPSVPDRQRDSVIDFWPGRPNKTLFPSAAWRRLADEALHAAEAHLTEYNDPGGIIELRAAIAQHVSRSRGVRCSEEAVIVTAGTQEAINLICRILVTTDTGVVMEDPCYGSALRTFQSYGARIFPVPVDRNGLVTDALPRPGGKSGVSLAYVTPSHQFPTGAALSLDRRQELLHWAHRTGAYLIEDDYDSDYNFDGPPFLSLAGADTGQCVIYVGTFSKSLGAGLRTGYVIVPPQLVDVARKVKAMTNYGHPWLEQTLLARFILEGGYRRHLRKIRKSYSDTLSCLISQIESTFGQADIWGAHAGMHVMWRLPENFSAADFKAKLDAHGGVRVHTLASGGAFEQADRYRDRAILLGYSALGGNEIRRAVQIMAEVIPRRHFMVKAVRGAVPA